MTQDYIDICFYEGQKIEGNLIGTSSIVETYKKWRQDYNGIFNDFNTYPLYLCGKLDEFKKRLSVLFSAKISNLIR